MLTPDIVRWSPNFNAGPVTGKTVIIHCTRSGKPMNPTEYVGTLSYMATKGTTSSQWVISRDGEKARVVPDDLQSWHASVDNDNTWGIELEQGAEQDGFTALQMDALVAVCRGYMSDFGVPAVHAISSTQPGFIGHQETAQGKSFGKSDPGRHFDWSWFIAALQPQGPVYEWREVGESMCLFRAGIPLPVFRIGGELPGQISKLMGDHYEWLVHGPNDDAVWSRTAGD